MIIKKRAATRGGGPSRNTDHTLDFEEDGWSPPEKPKADWKKLLLLTGLGILSWISTYTGMMELIQANMGELGLLMKIAIGFAVAMLMLMIIWLLDQLFMRLQFPVRVLYVAGYLFLTMISVGFGFGFYWKFLEARSEASRSAESAVTQVQSALHGAATRLEQLQTTLASLTAISAQKAIDERERGNSCPNSRPGDGPRRRLRDADAARFGFASKFVEQRVTAIKGNIGALNKDLKLVVNRDASTFGANGTRNAFLRGLNRKLDRAVTGFNAFRTDPQLSQFRSDFAERANKTVFDNGNGGTFTCPDPELQTALRGAVNAIDKLPTLEKPKIAAVEGPEAILEAFRRLTTTLYGALQFKMPPTPDELRDQQQRAIQAIENPAARRQILDAKPGLGERDYVPLFIALFVDFCLLLVSVSRPINGFQWLDHKMGVAQEWPVIKILSRFRDIHKDEEIREVFDVFRHVVFDWRGVYYAAIPINGTSPTYDGGLKGESATQAQLLANLFTSFENDKVFSRVPLSLFTTGFIQRKLREQGSKFAEAEAFRIYRFRKDMWQDWMLSAMMGAAKRVEARKRKQKLERELFGPVEPYLNEPANENDGNDGAAPGEATAAAESGPDDGHPGSEASPQHTMAFDGEVTEGEHAEELQAAIAEAVTETLTTIEQRRMRARLLDEFRAARPAAEDGFSANGPSSANGHARDHAGGQANGHTHANGRVVASHAAPPASSAEREQQAASDRLAERVTQAWTAHATNEPTHPVREAGTVREAGGVQPADKPVAQVSTPEIIHLAGPPTEVSDTSAGPEASRDPANGHVASALVRYDAGVDEPERSDDVRPTFDRRVRSALPAHMEPLASVLGSEPRAGEHDVTAPQYGNPCGSESQGLQIADPVDFISDERTEIIPRRPGDDLEMDEVAAAERAAWEEARSQFAEDHAQTLGNGSYEPFEAPDAEVHDDEGTGWDQPDIEIASISQWFRKGWEDDAASGR